MMVGEQPEWARMIGEALDTKARPAGEQQKRAVAFKEINLLAAIKANEALPGFREIPLSRQEAVNLFREAFRE